jgi:hypothetical protein
MDLVVAGSHDVGLFVNLNSVTLKDGLRRLRL